MKGVYTMSYCFAACKHDIDIAVFINPIDRERWLLGCDIVPNGDPILAEEREPITLEDVRMSLLPVGRKPLTNEEINEYINANAQPDDIVDGVSWLIF